MRTLKVHAYLLYELGFGILTTSHLVRKSHVVLELFVSGARLLSCLAVYLVHDGLCRVVRRIKTILVCYPTQRVGV